MDRKITAIRIVHPNEFGQYAVYEYDASGESELMMPLRRRGYLAHSSIVSFLSVYERRRCEALVASIFAMFDPFDVSIWYKDVEDEGESKKKWIVSFMDGKRLVTHSGETPFEALMTSVSQAYWHQR